MAGQRGIQRRLVAVCATLGLTTIGFGQVQHLWRQNAQVGGTCWRTVAVAADGSQLSANLEGGGGAITVCVASRAPSGPMIFTDTAGSAGGYGVVASARGVDLHADLAFVQAPTSGHWTPTLRTARSLLGGNAWTRSFEAVGSTGNSIPADVQLADDGSRIVAWWFDALTARTRVVVTDASGTVLLNSWVANLTQPRASALNASGTRLFLNVTNGLAVLDTVAGSVIASLNGWAAPTAGVATNAAGDVVAFTNSNGGVDVFRATNNGPLGYWTSVPGYAGFIASVLTISGDGTTLAAGYSSSVDSRQQKVRIVALGATPPVTLCEDSMQGQGNYTIFLTDLASSNTGDTIVLGTTGDQSNVLPEAVVYQRQASGTYARTPLDLPGSVFDVDLSRNSTVLGVVSASGHISTSPQSAGLDAYDLGSDITASGVPHANGIVQFDTATPTGETMILGRADGLLSTPIVLSGAKGLFYLQNPVVAGVAVGDAQGKAHFSFEVPGGADIGRTLYFQALRLSDRQLTKKWSALTIVP